MEKKQYAVLGLGRFGSTVATTLAKYDCDVIALDKDMECVERVSRVIEHVACVDFTNLQQLRELGVGECDVAILGSGDHLEESIIALMNLQELGVPYVIVKSKNKRYREILLRMGANEVVLPEKEMGLRIAKNLISGDLIDLIGVDNEYSVVEMNVPKSWVGKSLIELQLRSRYGINVVGIRRTIHDSLNINMDINVPLAKEQRLVVIVENEILEKNNYFSDL
ncbi:MAG: TrkA family potassium uptake protein [Erysipelotrichaceae bacterium]|nr:TrkA family potassium uptake protein [Erysipelotrichaceae bacterium]